MQAKQKWPDARTAKHCDHEPDRVRFLRPVDRLTHAVILAVASKKVENFNAATAIDVAVYNFCRIHSTIRCTPAMAAGVIDRHRDMNDLFDAVWHFAERKRKAARREKPIERLRNDPNV